MYRVFSVAQVPMFYGPHAQQVPSTAHDFLDLPGCSQALSVDLPEDHDIDDLLQYENLDDLLQDQNFAPTPAGSGEGSNPSTSHSASNENNPPAESRPETETVEEFYARLGRCGSDVELFVELLLSAPPKLRAPLRAKFTEAYRIPTSRRGPTLDGRTSPIRGASSRRRTASAGDKKRSVTGKAGQSIRQRASGRNTNNQAVSPTDNPESCDAKRFHNAEKSDTAHESPTFSESKSDRGRKEHDKPSPDKGPSPDTESLSSGNHRLSPLCEQLTSWGHSVKVPTAPQEKKEEFEKMFQCRSMCLHPDVIVALLQATIDKVITDEQTDTQPDIVYGLTKATTTYFSNLRLFPCAEVSQNL